MHKMSLAVHREPRKTAGNRMSKLLDAEEDDEFYKTTYGGFNDESGDDEYNEDHSDTEDEVDSDFDIDEGDEPDSAQEDDAPRRKSRVVTKAYKEPVKVAKPKPKPKRPSEETKKIEKKPKAELKRRIPQEFQDYGARKSVRQSTSEHTRKTNLRLQERQDAPRRRRGAHRDRPLTQEELLAEAKITAELNIRSLENYERLEADKKKQVHKKRRFEGPTIRYHSVLMPLVLPSHLKEENVDVEGLDQDVPQTVLPNPAMSSQQPVGGLCSRTFVTFSDDEAFNCGFPRSAQASPQIPVQEICPVTHKTALYRDPVTDIPYANARAFRIIREAYRKYVAAHGFPNASGGMTGRDAASRGARHRMLVKQSALAT
ncbi:vacuolar protein sorting 72 homolog a [Phycodurus eques]|uniref:vacuolar protein sorting 72 homolog a n=1 Tax=Phycodurus eques TaxID=693459 RepID=UPI002ACDBFA3|nr:vacuolar protein sorting 72 homolog a [Phycodurus eques]